jgi:hypothetical protein
VVTAESPRELSEDEAALVAFFDVLLGLGSSAPALPAPVTQGVGSHVWAAVAERAKRAALRFLARSGLTERVVLRDGRAVSGRLWDRHLNEGFVLRFGAGFLDAGLLLARRTPILRERSATKRFSVAPSVHAGDMILYTLAWRSTPRLGLLPDNTDLVRHAFVRSNPFTALHALHAQDAESADAAPFAPLLAPDRVRLLEVSDDSLESAWAQELRAAFPGKVGAVRLPRARLALGAFVSGLEGAHRLDLAGPALSALRQAVAPLEGADVRSVVLRSTEFRTVAARDDHCRSVAALFNIGRRLTRRYRELALARYGDDHYDEARAFVAVYERTFAAAEAENERIYRELVPVVGT